MVDKFTSKEIAEFKEAFDEFDKTGTGVITSQELVVLIKLLGQNPTDAEFNDMINEVVADSGQKIIDFPVFLKMMARMLLNNDEEEEIRQAYRCFARNKDNNIPTEELRYVMMNLGEKISKEEVDEMIKAADEDNSGFISMDEFRLMMKRH